MIWLLQFLFLGHIHKWKIIEGPNASEYWEGNKNNIVRKRIYYILQCEKCGNVKSKET